MAKYGKKAAENVERAMHEYKRGELKSSSGDKVTSREQAIAIGLSEAREAGGKVPERSSSGSKTGTRKASTDRKRTSTRKSPARSSGRSSSTARKRATATRMSSGASRRSSERSRTGTTRKRRSSRRDRSS